MSVPKKMQTLAAIYDCEIVELYSGEGDVLYARPKDVSLQEATNRQEFVCRVYYARDIDLNTLKEIVQRISGRTLAQFWTN
jgi:hypothetical protein